MPPCSQCGSEIRWAEAPEGRIKLDAIPAVVGPDRYREVSYQPLRVEPVADRYEATAYPKHECGAGRP